MIRYPNLIPECNVDTVFVESLGYREPNHAPDIHQVFSILEKKGANEKAIGFIDSDKKRSAYLNQFKVIENLGDVKLLKHTAKLQYLVMVSPAMDRFLYNLCNDLEVDLKKYQLPTKFEAFLAMTKKVSIINNPHFRDLLNTIRQKNPAKIARIQQWIQQYG